jgi:hypothetical protein
VSALAERGTTRLFTVAIETVSNVAFGFTRYIGIGSEETGTPSAEVNAPGTRSKPTDLKGQLTAAHPLATRRLSIASTRRSAISTSAASSSPRTRLGGPALQSFRLVSAHAS